MRRSIPAVAALAALVFTPGVSQAVITIDVGHHPLLPNQAGQEIEILVSGGEEAKLMVFYVQVGDGGPAARQLPDPPPGPGVLGPPIEDVDLLEGTIFAGLAQNDFGTNSVVPQFFDAEAGDFPEPLEEVVTTQGLLATVTIDTSRGNVGDAPFYSGSWDLKLRDTIEGESTWLSLTGAKIWPVITEGSITIVPEPSTLILLTVGAAAFVFYARRRRE